MSECSKMELNGLFCDFFVLFVFFVVRYEVSIYRQRRWFLPRRARRTRRRQKMEFDELSNRVIFNVRMFKDGIKRFVL